MPTKITSPYQFIPLSRWIYHPAWAAQVNHDLPFKDGLSGSFEITIKNHTPLFVGDEGKQFFKMPDGTPTIPGSSIKGMLRSVLEIASYGKMSSVDDRRFGIRDISKNDYTKPLYKDKIIKKKANAGYLQLMGEEIRMIPCEFCKLPYKLINNGNDIKNSSTTKKKYSTLLEATARADKIKFNFEEGEHSLVANQFGQGDNEGEVVMTGWMGNKENEFIFFTPEINQYKIIDDKLWRAFVDVNDAATNNLSDSLKGNWLGFWKERFLNGERVPIFYHSNTKGDITSFGLAYLYKLPYENTLKEVISHTSPDHLDDTKRDLSELIFGYIDESETTGGLKGRVSIGHAKAVDGYQWSQPHKLVLMGARPTFYPNYIKQHMIEGNGHKNRYVSYGDSDSEVNGWKRYPVHSSVNIPKLSKKDAVVSEITPLKTGTKFQANIRFHNLKPMELGALFWALNWGGDNKLRHSLGMGKPYGLGQVSITLNDNVWQDIKPNNEAANKMKSVDDCIKAFEAQLECAFSKAHKDSSKNKWKNSEALAQLRGMADPENAKLNNLSYMQLKDYQKAKGSGLFLKTYKMNTPETPDDFDQSSPGKKWVKNAVEVIMKANSNKHDEAMRGRPLANTWSELADEELKAEALVYIRHYWEKNEWWDSPPGKASKNAKKIYAPE